MKKFLNLLKEYNPWAVAAILAAAAAVAALNGLRLVEDRRAPWLGWTRPDPAETRAADGAAPADEDRPDEAEEDGADGAANREDAE